jgi:hypothetical protein
LAVVLATDQFLERQTLSSWEPFPGDGEGGNERRARTLRMLGHEDLAERFSSLIQGLRSNGSSGSAPREAVFRQALARAALYVSELTGQLPESAPFLATVVP